MGGERTRALYSSRLGKEDGLFKPCVRKSGLKEKRRKEENFRSGGEKKRQLFLVEKRKRAGERGRKGVKEVRLCLA